MCHNIKMIFEIFANNGWLSMLYKDWYFDIVKDKRLMAKKNYTLVNVTSVRWGRMSRSEKSD